MEKTLGPAAIGLRGLALPEAIDLARATGFGGLAFDIRAAAQLAADHGPAQVREHFDARGVRPSYWFLPIAWQDEAAWADERRRLSEFAALSRQIGCDRVTVFMPPGSNERPVDENFVWHVARFRPIAEALADEGCRLGIEFCGPKTSRADYRHEFIVTLGGTLELAKAIGTGNVGVLLDAWHLYTAGETIDDLDRLTADQIIAVHVNDAPAGIPRDEHIDQVRALPLETGVMDLVGFMRKLRDLGYAGPVMPEPFSRRVEDLAATDPRAAVVETARSMEALWRAAGLD
jgi:sugar phosphate isomerase/epimerase